MTPEPTPELPLVILLGPTASGKTALSLDLAAQLGAEVISADSRQVYRGMDVGTAKPSRVERSRVPHHLIDIVEPDQPFSLGEYLLLAYEAIDTIRARHHIPLLVGGSGQYVWALAEGWIVPSVAPNRILRASFEERVRVAGPFALHAELAQLDPVAARSIHPHNTRRVIRALELAAQTGEPASAVRARRAPRQDVVILGLLVDRPELYARIDRRVDQMFADGFVEEVERLLQLGYDPLLPSMSGIGYTQVVQILRGELTPTAATARVKIATHRFARQQSAWFRSDDARISWISPGDAAAAMERIHSWQPRLDAKSTGVIA